MKYIICIGKIIYLKIVLTLVLQYVQTHTKYYVQAKSPFSCLVPPNPPDHTLVMTYFD